VIKVICSTFLNLDHKSSRFSRVRLLVRRNVKISESIKALKLGLGMNILEVYAQR